MPTFPPERQERLLNQLEVRLEDAEAAATEAELAVECAAPSTIVNTSTASGPPESRSRFPARPGYQVLSGRLWLGTFRTATMDVGDWL